MEKSSITLTLTWGTQRIRYNSDNYLNSDNFPNSDNHPSVRQKATPSTKQYYFNFDWENFPNSKNHPTLVWEEP